MPVDEPLGHLIDDVLPASAQPFQTREDGVHELAEGANKAGGSGREVHIATLQAQGKGHTTRRPLPLPPGQRNVGVVLALIDQGFGLPSFSV